MAMTLGLAAAVTFARGGEVGVSALIEGRIIVRVLESSSLAEFVSAFESDYPGVTLVQLDEIASRSTYLMGVDGPPGTDMALIAERVETDYAAQLRWGEGVYENATPESHTGNTGSVFVDGVADAAIYEGQYAGGVLNLDDAHQVTTGASVLVAVVDTGIDAMHPRLAGRVVAGGFDFVAGDATPDDDGDGVDNDGDGMVDEMAGHGTFVAGLVNLVAPDASLLPVRVLDSDGFGNGWTLTQGIQLAIERGADVINLSLGSTYNSNAVNDAIKEAMVRGIVTVSAAGNLDRALPREYPAMRSDGFGVAATDHADIKADFSNFDDKIFISAPGASFFIGGDPQNPDPALSIVSTIPGGGYAVWAGTSMSAPFVSGASALVRAQHPQWPCPPPPPPYGEETPPNCAYVGIESVLVASAVDIYPLNPAYAEDEQLGVGRLDVAGAAALGPVAPGPGDVDFDGVVGVEDLLLVILGWGPCPAPVGCAGDANRDGVVNVEDLLIVILNWG
ncbi:MAG: S8 family serine peptidase [Planctomycetota bacterium]